MDAVFAVAVTGPDEGDPEFLTLERHLVADGHPPARDQRGAAVAHQFDVKRQFLARANRPPVTEIAVERPHADASITHAVADLARLADEDAEGEVEAIAETGAGEDRLVERHALAGLGPNPMTSDD